MWHNVLDLQTIDLVTKSISNLFQNVTPVKETYIYLSRILFCALYLIIKRLHVAKYDQSSTVTPIVSFKRLKALWIRLEV